MTGHCTYEDHPISKHKVSTLYILEGDADGTVMCGPCADLEVRKVRVYYVHVLCFQERQHDVTTKEGYYAAIHKIMERFNLHPRESASVLRDAAYYETHGKLPINKRKAHEEDE